MSSNGAKAAQGASLADQITHLILGLPSVTDGINQLMDYAVDGIALGGWQLIDLSMMGAIGCAQMCSGRSRGAS